MQVGLVGIGGRFQLLCRAWALVGALAQGGSEGLDVPGFNFVGARRRCESGRLREGSRRVDGSLALRMGEASHLLCTVLPACSLHNATIGMHAHAAIGIRMCCPIGAGTHA